MPGYIDIQIVGDTKGVEAMLQRLELKLNPASLAAFMKIEVDPYLAQRASDRFANEGDDVVGAWAPLQAATQAIRASQGYGSAHPINRRTGELERYIVQSGGDVSVNPAGAELTFPGSPASGELADKVKTAQSGRGVPPTIPRPVLGLNSNDLLAVLTQTALYIQAP